MSSTKAAIPWRKRSLDSDSSPTEGKRPKESFCYNRLASDSTASADSDDKESCYSIQDKETDVVRDTSDTNSDSSEYEVEIEYELDSECGSDNEHAILIDSSTDSEDFMLAAAAAVCDSSMEAFITDAEDSDNQDNDSVNSLQNVLSSATHKGFENCVQCKRHNDNPQFRYCDKCFQGRKTLFPPRPRRHKKVKPIDEVARTAVKLDDVSSCLSGLASQDSGIGSSQEFPSLCLDQIVVPKHLQVDASQPSTSNSVSTKSFSRKRQYSESSLSEEYELQAKPKKSKHSTMNEDKDVKNVKEDVKPYDLVLYDSKNKDVRTENSDIDPSFTELKAICIMCHTNPKNGIFLHGRIAHMCCCYRCAMRTWKSVKRCPICKRKVNNVVKVFIT